MMKRRMKLLEAERDKPRDDNMRSGVSALQRHCKQVRTFENLQSSRLPFAL